MSAQIVGFQKQEEKGKRAEFKEPVRSAKCVAFEQLAAAGYFDPKPFAGLPFVSEELFEHGWPKKNWVLTEAKDKDHSRYHECARYAELAIERMVGWQRGAFNEP